MTRQKKERIKSINAFYEKELNLLKEESQNISFAAFCRARDLLTEERHTSLDYVKGQRI